MERKLDETSVNAKNVDAKVDHLKSLNKWFFLPSFGGGKVSLYCCDSLKKILNFNKLTVIYLTSYQGGQKRRGI
jgi:hypothetical protein